MNLIKNLIISLFLMSLICEFQKLISSAVDENNPLINQRSPIMHKVFENGRVTVYTIKENKRTLITAIHKNGTKNVISKNEFIAMHEAAHITAFTDEPSLSIIEQATILENQTSAGSTDIEPAYNIEKNIIELEHSVIGFLAGAIANQIALQIEPFQTIQDIDMFFSNDAYKYDWSQAYKNIVKIVKLESSNPAIYQLLLQERTLDLYYKTYKFVLENQLIIEKLTRELLRKKTLSQNEIYKTLDKDLPLYDFQEGPLPYSLQHHYQFRERSNVAA